MIWLIGLSAANARKSKAAKVKVLWVSPFYLEAIERCSGHNRTYAVKKEFHAASMKIVKPVASRVKQLEVDHYGSDCPMAGTQIQNGLQTDKGPEHPLKLLRLAYGI